MLSSSSLSEPPLASSPLDPSAAALSPAGEEEGCSVLETGGGEAGTGGLQPAKEANSLAS